MENVSRIILSRGNEWLNQSRPYKVFIDGAEVGTIKTSSETEYIVPEGGHTVQCRLAWYGSRDGYKVDVRPGENIYLRVRSGMKYYLLLVLLLIVGFLINFFYSTRPYQKPVWISFLQLALTLPSLLYLLYYLTIGRKNYLILEEDKEKAFV